ncbi:MAG: hypothetical protein A3C79_01405 [Candidatus Taylorbacteria bacterium RIFCSPHIGHO2_02_FULL_45_28]|uniref:Leucine-binding protein domain-containing protein n=1 Tax=Candidatus Taylorbacteria bacterium RIFCSPHIGHO2_12_FULL_45_16 TaxID=1802315 RepID=A0A1G2N0M5_9BACT|nr:MAG: hypothetical protein A2830_03570 [Candidatus Taylorbacteria bacterium RIFCSPHIGHO2_01_FULL_44_110]OHA25098.1 MAG: hypothetical protein A3C79_01405 [Candidatus Taylorbacteria bacterium RIFCSPHIGHO2_02_FULL_45_28]OHA28979.1 MAG: hypothetical protein A3F51_01790 [Candidatus Taylorbacteria bacterium RIFCSPHIGHO2_12_FULL_45_16]OHA33097.1 MAG: hypothetical protein A3A23_03470 [Candidatus Taylorbacteria bacterium RIFCSPLOWO2_01_FULL_45_59]OHA39414.1 MAG: hypothetical protein A3I98_02465 [Candi
MSKTLKIIITVIVVALIIWIIATKGEKPANQPLRVGVISVLSGPFADYGEEVRKGVLSEASSTPDVEFVFEDDKCEPKDAVSAFNKLVQFEKIQVIIGPVCGSPQEAVIPLIKETGAIVLVPSAASSDLYSQSGGNFFNVQYSLEDESTFVAMKMNERGYKKVALVSYRNAFSETHVKAFKQKFTGEIIDHIFVDANSDVASELAKIKAEKPDAIYSPDAAFFFGNGVIKLRQLGVMAPIFGTYVTELPAVRTLVPDVFYSYPGNLEGTQGAVYELSKQAARIAVGAVKECSNDTKCIKKKLDLSGTFDVSGVYKRPLILKQVKGNEVVEVK